MITSLSLITAGISFLGGLALSGIGLYNFARKRISTEEAARIYAKVKKTITDYRAAVSDGVLTTDEKIQVAEDAIQTMEEIIEDLKQ